MNNKTHQGSQNKSYLSSESSLASLIVCSTCWYLTSFSLDIVLSANGRGWAQPVAAAAGLQGGAFCLLRSGRPIQPAKPSAGPLAAPPP
eukprot:scaffold15083_cov71-Isochrysis_galbana.AAC.2